MVLIMVKRCFDCKDFKKINEQKGECREFRFLINLDLAKKQKICEKDWHHRMPDGARVFPGVTPQLLIYQNKKRFDKK